MARNGSEWPTKLAERCRNVGWDVSRTNAGHFKVRTETGRSFVFASTPSSNASERNALAEARRHGLETLEQRVALEQERDRLERIERDRAPVEAHLRALEKRAQEDEMARGTKPEPTKAETESKPDMGEVNGVAIVARDAVMIKTPVMKDPAPMADCSELLLADGRVVYRCEKLGSWKTDENADKPCHAIFESVGSLQSHIMFHTRKKMPVPPAVRARQEAEAEAVEPQPQQPAEPAAQPAGVVALAVDLIGQIESAQGDLDKLSDRLAEIAEKARSFAGQLPESVADDETREKARRYDEMRRLMN